MQYQIREQVNHLLMEALTARKDMAPWQQPWTPDVASTMPINVGTNLPYRDINPILLRLEAVKNGYRSKWWGTEKQWRVFGGKVKAGAVGARTFYHHDLECAPNILEPSFAVVKAETVYNLDSIEGDFPRLRPAGNKALTESVKDGRTLWKMTSERGTVHVEAEALLDALKAGGADFREVNGNKAIYYRPPEDYILTPLKLQFDFGPGGPEAYYGTVFHEFAHWTECRMNWLADPARSVKDRYALGELRSDITSAYVCAHFGIPPNQKNLGHGKYLKHWLRVMGEDNSVIFRIARAASKAADYLLAFSKPKQTGGGSR